MRWFILLLIISVAHAFIATGTSTVSSLQGLNTIGFNFSTGTITGNDGDFYYYENAIWTNGPGGIKDMGVIDVNACDIEGYIKSNIPAIQGHTYCIKTNEGSYAKIEITNVNSNSLSFNWAHQRDGTNLFPKEEAETQPQAININYALIGIIIVLAIIIFIIWKFR